MRRGKLFTALTAAFLSVSMLACPVFADGVTGPGAGLAGTGAAAAAADSASSASADASASSDASASTGTEAGGGSQEVVTAGAPSGASGQAESVGTAYSTGLMVATGTAGETAEAPASSSGGDVSNVDAAAASATATDSDGVTPLQMDAETDAARAALLANTQTAGKTDQIILLVDHDLSLWNKQADGSWTKAMEAYAGYGKNGLKLAEDRTEGDLTTPIGAFPILHAFGNAANPGTSMTYRDTTPYSYWSGEEATYNTWVESEVPINGEHLQEYGAAYNYALAIGFNIDPVVYLRGSAIFLHIRHPERWYTAGCVSLQEADVVQLLRLCHDGVWMIIVPDQDSIARY